MSQPAFSPLPCRTIPPFPGMFPPLLILQCFQEHTQAVSVPHTSVRRVGVQRSTDWDRFLPKLVHLDVGSQPASLWSGRGARWERKAGEIWSSKTRSERIRENCSRQEGCCGLWFLHLSPELGWCTAGRQPSLPLWVLPVPRAVLRQRASSAEEEVG